MIDMNVKYELTAMRINESKQIDGVVICLDVAFGDGIDTSLVKHIAAITYHTVLLSKRYGATRTSMSSKNLKYGIRHLMEFESVDSAIEFILQISEKIFIDNIITLVHVSDNSYDTYETLDIKDGILSSESGCDEVTLRNCQNALDKILAIEGLISLLEK